MTTPLFLDNPDYSDSARFILEAHAKLARGESSLPDTDAEYDRMEEAWFNLSPAEKARLDGLSADLHMLEDEEVHQQLDPAERSPERLGHRLQTALHHNNWEEVLVLLRYGPPFLSRDQIALLRGRAWEELGHDEAALLFFDYARKVKPDNTRAQWFGLHTLLKLGRVAEALKRSEEYATAETTNPAALLPFVVSTP